MTLKHCPTQKNNKNFIDGITISLKFLKCCLTSVWDFWVWNEIESNDLPVDIQNQNMCPVKSTFLIGLLKFQQHRLDSPSFSLIPKRRLPMETSNSPFIFWVNSIELRLMIFLLARRADWTQSRNPEQKPTPIPRK